MVKILRIEMFRAFISGWVTGRIKGDVNAAIFVT